MSALCEAIAIEAGYMDALVQLQALTPWYENRAYGMRRLDWMMAVLAIKATQKI